MHGADGIRTFDLMFEDAGDQELKNIVLPVRVYHVVFGTGAAKSTTGAEPEVADADKPSIAVLPFNNMSGDPEQEYFSDGITEDIITDLSKISGLFVISRNTSFTYKGKALQMTHVAAELGVKHQVTPRNGDMVRLAPGLPEIIDEVASGRLFVDGGMLVPEAADALRERRHASHNGMIFVAFALDCLEKGTPYKWAGRSPKLNAAIELLGVGPLLEYPA